MKIVWPEKKFYAEAVKYGFEYVLLGAQNKPLHGPVQCKDFFNDAFWSEAMGKPAKIYGFAWEPGMLPKAKTYRIAVRYNGEDMTEYAKNLARFLHALEKNLEFDSSKVVVDETGKTAVVTFDASWVSKPILVSAFTLFLRVGCLYEEGSVAEYLDGFPKRTKVLAACDQTYVQRALPRLHEIVKGKSNFKQSWSDYTESNISALHHSSGVVNWRG